MPIHVQFLLTAGLIGLVLTILGILLIFYLADRWSKK